MSEQAETPREVDGAKTEKSSSDWTEVDASRLASVVQTTTVIVQALDVVLGSEADGVAGIPAVCESEVGEAEVPIGVRRLMEQIQREGRSSVLDPADAGGECT